ncbi:hypothetical protein [Mongoliimonas terrestris]|uniref:hypothetical protein n=1 Tax=Mongoliimonas terrestris TaxID=1709001 RepID=UPI000949A1D5|nr:hypothetical protein [Mongoliimonas terrestris]
MANSLRGEVAFEALGATYTLVFDFNALVDLEEEFDIEASRLGDILQSGRAGNLRRVFRIGLARFHAGITDAQAGDVISVLGPQRAGELIAEAFTKAFPKAEAASGSARPPKARAGTR